MTEHDIVIIGAGPAGMAAAIAAYDAGVTDVVLLDREPQLGGILMQCIHNGFGLHSLGRELTGPEYAAVYAGEVAKRDITVFLETTVTAISPDRTVTACSRSGILKIRAKAIILAMGCRERSRGALNICGSRPASIYSAGTAQKMVNCMGLQVGKRVVILGSGDIGLIMARRMCFEGAKVEAVCEIMPYSGGLQRNIVQCLEDFGIPLYLNTTAVQIHGNSRLEGVTIATLDRNREPIEETKRFIPCDTLLLSVGLIPENELTRTAGIPIDPLTNGAIVSNTCETQVPGIFACGNVLHVHDLVDYVSDEAARAGSAAAAFVLGKMPPADSLATAPGSGIRYVLPHRIHRNHEDVSLFMRVAAPCRNVRLVVSDGEKILTSVKRLKVSPGEMEKITLKASDLEDAAGPISVSLEVLE